MDLPLAIFASLLGSFGWSRILLAFKVDLYCALLLNIVPAFIAAYLFQSDFPELFDDFAWLGGLAAWGASTTGILFYWNDAGLKR